MHRRCSHLRLGEDNRRKLNSHLFTPLRREEETVGIQARDRREMPDHDGRIAKRLTLKVTYSGNPIRRFVMEWLVVEDESLCRMESQCKLCLLECNSRAFCRN